VVYVRKFNDQRLTMTVSGTLWRNGLVMEDLETGTYWSQITGEGVTGKFKGKTLLTVPVVQTAWSDWYRSHPDTKVLKKNRAIRSSVYEAYFKDPTRNGLFRTEWLINQMPGKELVHGVADGPHALAVRDKTLKRGNLLHATLGDKAVLVVRTSDNGVRAYFASTSEGRTLKFHPGKDPNSAMDRETGSTWNLAQGICIAGEYQGKKLEPLPVTVAFWFAWSTFYPNTRIVRQ
jgi:hypothetical protein